jgi:hypothetical protein
MSVYAGPNSVESGLVLALDAGNTKSYPGSGTAWTDLSGNGNAGTLTNGPTYDANNLGSIVFDGVNDNINVGNGVSLSMGTGDFTLESVFKPTGSATYRIIFQKGNPGIGANKGYRIRIEADNTVQMTVTGDQEYVATSAAITYNNYYHIAATKGSGGLIMYLNGVQSGTTGTSPTGTTNNANNFTIGLQDGGNWAFSGNIPIVKVYNRALSAAEISQNFNASRGRFGI